jgi:hypothetical protein
VVYLLQIVKVLVIAVRFYPILSAVYINSILTLTCATLYAWLDFSISIINQNLCQNDFYTSDDTFARTNETNIEVFFQGRRDRGGGGIGGYPPPAFRKFE